MSIPFWKMHGAGNDFVLVDDRDLTFPVDERDWMAQIASRRFGIGCDGILLIQPSEKNDFRMLFFNPDGGEADMCGNGARCIARLAHDIGLAPEQMAFDTLAGTIRAHRMGGDQMLLHMTEPKDLSLHISLLVEGEELLCHVADTGVPHVVHIVDDVNTIDLQCLGAAIRYHERFAPTGTNANFVQVTGDQSIRVRTYERGVEAETLACGTGIVASAIVAGLVASMHPPVDVVPSSGDTITVDFSMENGKPANITMLGPAVHVFQGTLPEPNEA